MTSSLLHHSRGVVLALALAAISPPAVAQDTTALATEYVNMPEVQQMITEMFSPEAMGAQVAAGLPPNVTINADQQARIGVVMSEAMNGLRPRLEALMVTSSAEVFTAPELQALIDFYRSEHGANIMSKMQPLMARTMSELAPDMQALQRQVGPDVARILREQ